MVESNGNGSMAGVWKDVPAKWALGLLAGALLSGAMWVGLGYVERIERVEASVQRIDQMANDIIWIKKYLENNRR